MRTTARFPTIAPAAAHYESFYAKACHPDGGLGLWIRHTIHKPPGGDPSGSVWLVLFDAARPAPVAAKATFAASDLATPEGSYLRIDGAAIGPGFVEGRIAAGAVEAHWSLTFRDRDEPLRHLPMARLYDWPLPRTKLLSPHPGAAFDGRLSVGERTIEVAGWPGMVGHNWGSEHAERWIWMHGGRFRDGRSGWLDVAAGRVRIGPFTTPWVANGMLSIDGERLRLGGLAARVRIDESPTGCRFVLPGKDVRVTGRVAASARDFVGWLYADPEGGTHDVVNCSIADMELHVERPGRPALDLEVAAGAAYELGMHERDHGIPLRPFGDGDHPAPVR